jgi:hypothetical protein
MQAYSFTVTAVDPYGNVATGYTGTIHFTSDEDHADLPADYTFTAANAGTHTYFGTFNRFGTFYLRAVDKSDRAYSANEAASTCRTEGANQLPGAAVRHERYWLL